MPLIDLAKVKKLDLIGWINSLPQFAKVCCLDWDIAFFFLPKMRQTDSLMEVWSKRRNESAENHAYRKWDRPTHWWRSGMRNATPIAEATRSYRSEQTGTNRRASGQRWPSWKIYLDCSNHLNTGRPNTRLNWIPNTWCVRYSNGKVTWLDWPFEYGTIWAINRLFQSSFQTIICILDHLTTRHKSAIWIPN